jgi:hypothetical protein
MGNHYYQSDEAMRFYLVLFLQLLTIITSAHPVSLNWVNARVDQKEITLTYKLLAEDLVLFYGNKNLPHHLTSNYLNQLLEGHAREVLNHFKVTKNEEIALKGKVVYTDGSSLKSDHIHADELMKYELYIHLKYEFQAEGWESLTFQQNLNQLKNAIPVVTFLTIFDTQGQQTLAENYELKPESPVTIRKGNPIKQLSASQSTTSHYSITDVGVRHELTMESSTFKSLLLDSGEVDHTHPDHILSYFHHHHHVHHEGQKVLPELSFTKSLINNSTGDGLIYIDLLYPIRTYTDSLKLTWDDYNWKLRWFDTQIQTGDTTLHHRFTRFQPVFIAPTFNQFKPRD